LRSTSPEVLAAAAVHGYTTAFWWSAAIFATGVVLSSLVLRSGAPRTAVAPSADPVLAH
jgi:predicted cobalt transporter CbtA